MEKLNPMNFRTNAFLLLVFFCTTLFSQDFQLGGYTKYLFSSTKIEMNNFDENLIDHTLHSRLNLKYFFNENIVLSGGIRNRIIWGESVNKIPGYSESFNQENYLINAGKFLWNKKNSINYLEADRFSLNFNFDKLQIDLGRQRIAWGTSWVWNITDLFNPLSILDFDYEERPAVDGIRLQYFSSVFTKIDFAHRFAKDKEQTTAIQFYLNKYEYDFYFLIGYHTTRPMIGFSWSGDIYDAGFRGEILAAAPPSKIKSTVFNLFKDEKRVQLSAVLSLDYSFSNSLYLHSEILFNNIGKKENIQLFTIDSRKIGLLSPSIIELFYQAGYNLSPLTRVDLITLHNPIDKSFAILPTFSYSLMENLDLSIIGLFLRGNKLAEYSPDASMLFGRLKFSF